MCVTLPPGGLWQQQSCKRGTWREERWYRCCRRGRRRRSGAIKADIAAEDKVGGSLDRDGVHTSSDRANRRARAFTVSFLSRDKGDYFLS